MTEKLMQALEAQKRAEESLEIAKQSAREAAMEHFREALSVCEMAVVPLPDLGVKSKRGGWKRSAADRARARERQREVWARKTAEERAEWLRKLRIGRLAASGAVQ